MSTSSRHLNWPHCYNVRDLGGLNTVSGGTTQFGRIVRSDLPGQLTTDSRKLMWKYGIRTILDLRTPWQAVAEPSNVSERDDAPCIFTYLNISIETYKPEVSTEIQVAGSRQAVYCIILDNYQDQIRLIMEAIASAQEGGILVHCHGGKDRTGIISALLLGLAGVPHTTIADDYAQSQVCLWPLWEKIVQEAGGIDKADIFLRPDATEEAIQFALDHLDRKYGGIGPYLHDSGLGSTTLDQLRDRLTVAKSDCVS